MSEFLSNVHASRRVLSSPRGIRCGPTRCPEWFRDAKLGIWAHWGPQCVPMYGDWYARHMYWEGHAQYLHHWRTYGHPSKFGYKEIAKLWKAERFDPEGLMDLYARAGAKYFVAQAVHHDNFDNWNSTHNPWNATKVGPMRDIVGLWKQAAKKRGLRFGVSEHLGASFSWWVTNKGPTRPGRTRVCRTMATTRHSRISTIATGAPRSSARTTGASIPGTPTDPWWHEQLVQSHHRTWSTSTSRTCSTPTAPLPWDKVGLSVVANLYNLSAKLHGGTNQADLQPEGHRRRRCSPLACSISSAARKMRPCLMSGRPTPASAAGSMMSARSTRRRQARAGDVRGYRRQERLPAAELHAEARWHAR